MQGRKNGQARAKGRGEDTEGRTKKKVRTERGIIKGEGKKLGKSGKGGRADGFKGNKGTQRPSLPCFGSRLC